MEQRDQMPYVAKILREKLLQEEKSLTFFETNLNSKDDLVRKQSEGNISSNKSRIEELKNAIEYLKTYKKTTK